MKRFVYLMTIALLALTLYGCKKRAFNEALTIYETTLDVEFLSAIPAAGGSSSLEFESSSDWSISISDTRTSSWLSVTPSSGAAGRVTVSIEVSENDTPNDRHSVITISAGSMTKNINVTQKQKDALTITSARFEIPKEGERIVVEVKTNIDFQVTIAESCKGWISQVVTKLLPANHIYFEIAPTSGMETREGTITISSGEFSEQIKVLQASARILILTEQEQYFPSSGGSAVVELSSNFDFDVVMPSVDWINESTTRAVSSHTRYFDISTNASHEGRSAEIIFKSRDDELSETLTINQVKLGAIVVSKKRHDLKQLGGTINVVLEKNVVAEITIHNNDWISQLSAANASEPHKLRFKIDSYSGTSLRSGRITIKNNSTSLTEDIIINQTVVDSDRERQALVAFYDATNGDSWIDNANWCSNRPIGEWYGVSEYMDVEGGGSLRFI